MNDMNDFLKELQLNNTDPYFDVDYLIRKTLKFDQQLITAMKAEKKRELRNKKLKRINYEN